MILHKNICGMNILRRMNTIKRLGPVAFAAYRVLQVGKATIPGSQVTPTKIFVKIIGRNALILMIKGNEGPTQKEENISYPRGMMHTIVT